jgi:hypothetical protein
MRTINSYQIANGRFSALVPVEFSGGFAAIAFIQHRQRFTKTDLFSGATKVERVASQLMLQTYRANCAVVKSEFGS